MSRSTALPISVFLYAMATWFIGQSQPLVVANSLDLVHALYLVIGGAIIVAANFAVDAGLITLGAAKAKIPAPAIYGILMTVALTFYNFATAAGANSAEQGLGFVLAGIVFAVAIWGKAEGYITLKA